MDPLSMLDTLGLIPLLAWLHIRGEASRAKQSDQLQDLTRSQFDRFEAMKSEADARQVEMVKGWRKEERARWAKVVEKYDKERDKLLLGVESKLDRILSSK